MQIEQMPKFRIFFEKTGRAKYTSHLDTMRTLTRALRRSGLPVWYTEGFNPHLYMTFALPVALGVESRCESFDLRMTREIGSDEVLETLNHSLPPGFRAVSAAPPVMDPGRIAWADYEIRLIYEGADIAGIHGKLGAFLAQPVVEAPKRTKKGEKMIDLRPLVQVLEAGSDRDTLVLRLRLAAGNAVNIAPSLFLKAFYAWSGILPDGVRVTRAAILTEYLEPFR